MEQRSSAHLCPICGAIARRRYCSKLCAVEGNRRRARSRYHELQRDPDLEALDIAMHLETPTQRRS